LLKLLQFSGHLNRFRHFNRIDISADDFCGRWAADGLHKQYVTIFNNFCTEQILVFRGILRYKLEGELSDPPNEREAGNGACMRILPVAIACLYRDDLFATWTMEQNHVTHNNQLSDQATLTMGNMVRHLLLSNDTKAALAIEALIQQHDDFNYLPYPKKTSGYIVHTVQTVMHFLDDTDNFEDCLVQTVNMGGDADTTGAIVGMLAGAKYGVSAIPERWLTALNRDIDQQIHQQTDALLKLAAVLKPSPQ